MSVKWSDFRLFFLLNFLTLLGPMIGGLGVYVYLFHDVLI